MSDITCGGCDSVWSGVNRAHCAAKGCHHTFGGVTAFDNHRRRNKCIHPAELGLTQNSKGVWTSDYAGPEEN